MLSTGSSKNELLELVENRWGSNVDTTIRRLERYHKTGGDINAGRVLVNIIKRNAYSNDKGNLSIPTWLIENGYDINAADSEGLTPLSHAAKEDYAEMVDLLIQRGADVNKVCNQRKSSLWYACFKGALGVVEKLVNCGAILDSRDKDGMTVLSVCALHGKDKIALALLGYRSSVHAKCNRDRTPLWYAVERCSIDVIRRLVEQGSNIDEFDDEGMSCLMRAASLGRNEVVELLLGCGADRTKVSKLGRTALSFAVEKCSKQTIKNLMWSDDSINQGDYHGLTPLMYAAKVGVQENVEALVQSGANPGIRCNAGRSALSYSVGEREKWSTVKYLVDITPSLTDMADSLGITPIMYASEFEFGDSVVTLLINAGASVHTSDIKGNRPLHYASWFSANALLEAGADINVINNDGICASDLVGESFGKVIKSLFDLFKKRSKRETNSLIGFSYALRYIADAEKYRVSLSRFPNDTFINLLIYGYLMIGTRLFKLGARINVNDSINWAEMRFIGGDIVDKSLGLGALLKSLSRIAFYNSQVLENGVTIEDPELQAKFLRLTSKVEQNRDVASWHSILNLPSPGIGYDKREVQTKRKRLILSEVRLRTLTEASSRQSTPTLCNSAVNTSELEEFGPVATTQISVHAGFAHGLDSTLGAIARFRLPLEFQFQYLFRALLQNPREKISTLLIPALGKLSSQRDTAESMLRFLARNGYEKEIGDIGRSLGDDVLAGVTEILSSRNPWETPRLGRYRYNLSVDREMPWFWGSEFLPPIRLKGTDAVLPIDAVDALGKLMSLSNAVCQFEVLKENIAVCDPQSLGAFAWAVFEDWEQKGDERSIWMFDAIAYLGDDSCAQKLSRRIRDWPRIKNQPRAYRGLAILATMGTDFSLRQLNALATNNRYASVRYLAELLIEEVAKSRRLSSLELEDRLVPDLGLSPEGMLELDFGPRRFVGSVDTQLNPMLTNNEGNRINKLPSTRSGDDKTLAKAARQRWTTFCRELRSVAKAQLDRLETAMIQGRHWSVIDFQNFLCKSPLLQRAVQGLVWVKISDDRLSDAAFRVNEQGAFETVQGVTLCIEEKASVRVIHPVEFDANTLRDWQEVFTEKRLAQPFSQLARKIYRRADDVAGDFFGLQDLRVASMALYGLKARGWELDGDSYGGSFSRISKKFGCSDVSVYLKDAFLHIGYGFSDKEETRIEVMISGVDDSIGFSEAIREVMTLKSH